tara:strand:+ start:268 stop:399 length:132 start_codon:yes stop_codon:yes gene_type:complete
MSFIQHTEATQKEADLRRARKRADKLKKEKKEKKDKKDKDKDT